MGSDGLSICPALNTRSPESHLDPVALELRKTAARDLDVAIVGDLCSVELPQASFDVVFSSYVLEHVPRADVALQNFVKWLSTWWFVDPARAGNAIQRADSLLRMPPHGAHVLFYRHVLGSKTAGQPGYAPYPAYYHPIIGRERLCRFLGERHVRCVGAYGNGFKSESRGCEATNGDWVCEKSPSTLSFGG